MYGLDRRRPCPASTARAFADELIPHEVEAERTTASCRRASSTSTDGERSSSACTPRTSPRRVGGHGCTALQQVLVQEQGGRVTNALGWVHGHAARLVAVDVATDYQRERWLLPTVRGEHDGVLRDHRGARRVGRRRPGGHRPAATATTTSSTA